MTEGGLRTQGLRAVKWSYIGTVGRALAQIVSLLVLARLLGPGPIGEFGYAFLLISFLAIVAEMGLSAALVQRDSLARELLGRALTRLLIVAFAIASLVIVLSDVLATHLFSQPELAGLIAAIAPSLVVSALAVPAAAMLKRELRFKALTLIGLASYCIGYLGVGIAAAAAGAGAWSLLAAWYTQNIIATLAMIWLVRPFPKIGNPRQLQGLERFGAVITATYVMNWLIDNAAHFFVGRFFGPAALGALTVANNLVRTPAGHLVTSLQTVLFPASARVQHDNRALTRAYCAALSGIALVAIPFFSLAAVLSSTLVEVLLGEKWREAAPLFTPLALSMIPHCLMAIAGPVLGGRGEPMAELRVQALTAILGVAAFAVSVQMLTLTGVVWVLFGIFTIRWLAMTRALARSLDLKIGIIIRAMRGGLILAAVLCVVASATEFAAQGVPPVGRLLVIVASAGLTGLIVLLRWPAVCLDQGLAVLIHAMMARRLETLPGTGRLRRYLHDMAV